VPLRHTMLRSRAPFAVSEVPSISVFHFDAGIAAAFPNSFPLE
jgi:hypothetical protein